MSRAFLDFVEDILDAMEKAEILVEGIEYHQFEADFRTHFAVVRALEIIGEAARRIPDSVRQQYPQIPWRSMTGMRDRIIHGYDKVDLQIVWAVVIQDLPHLKPVIRQILQDYPDPSP